MIPPPIIKTSAAREEESVIKRTAPLFQFSPIDVSGQGESMILLCLGNSRPDSGGVVRRAAGWLFRNPKALIRNQLHPGARRHPSSTDEGSDFYNRKAF